MFSQQMQYQYFSIIHAIRLPIYSRNQSEYRNVINNNPRSDWKVGSNLYQNKYPKIQNL